MHTAMQPLVWMWPASLIFFPTSCTQACSLSYSGLQPLKSQPTASCITACILWFKCDLCQLCLFFQPLVNWPVLHYLTVLQCSISYPDLQPLKSRPIASCIKPLLLMWPVSHWLTTICIMVHLLPYQGLKPLCPGFQSPASSLTALHIVTWSLSI